MFALEGKTSRGARCLDGRAVHLFAALDQVSGVVMGRAQVPAVDTTSDKGHGRVETRIVKLVEIPAGIAFPHAR
jgi:hypothetical protein